MEKYLLFAYRDYYPQGGMEDCILVTDSYEELNEYVPEYIQENDAYDFDKKKKKKKKKKKTYIAEFDEYILPKKRFIKWELWER